MSLEHVLLGMLREPASGYDLRKEFEAGTQHFWWAELSQIYPALKRMMQRGWLDRDTAPSSRGPERRVYRRTAAGTTELESWLSSEPLGGRERIPYIAQLVFLGELDDADATITFLEALQRQLLVKLKIIESAMSELNASGDPETMDATTLHEYMSLKMGLAVSRARVSCCEECLALARKTRALHAD